MKFREGYRKIGYLVLYLYLHYTAFLGRFLVEK